MGLTMGDKERIEHLSQIGAKMVGRKVAWVRHREIGEGTAFPNLDSDGVNPAAELFEIGLDDGTVIAIRSQDFEGYESWLVISEGAYD